MGNFDYITVLYLQNSVFLYADILSNEKKILEKFFNLESNKKIDFTRGKSSFVEYRTLQMKIFL